MTKGLTWFTPDSNRGTSSRPGSLDLSVPTPLRHPESETRSPLRDSGQQTQVPTQTRAAGPPYLFTTVRVIVSSTLRPLIVVPHYLEHPLVQFRVKTPMKQDTRVRVLWSESPPLDPFPTLLFPLETTLVKPSQKGGKKRETEV